MYELIHDLSILLCEVSDSDLQRNFWPSLPRAGETIHQSSGLTSGKKNCVHQTFGCCRVSVALPSLKIWILYSISSSTLALNLSVVFCFVFCSARHIMQGVYSKTCIHHHNIPLAHSSIHKVLNYDPTTGTGRN